MNFVTSIILGFAAVTGSIVAVISILFFVRLRWPAPILWFAKLYASALSWVFAFLGLLVALTGLVTGSGFATLIGFYDAAIFFMYVLSVTRSPAHSSGFGRAFGRDWQAQITPEQKRYFLPSRLRFKLPDVPAPRFEQNVPFATIPGTDRKLLCDVWQPPQDVTPSGLAFIYLHGSAFYLLDKDYGTRTFFRHLAAQGHVIMDVAYRMFPETDMMGMVHDVKRAVVWIKENAPNYRVDPGRIVLGGGSAGAHLALLAGYTFDNPKFLPKELEGRDTSVNAVVSLYGSSDMASLYYHTNQHLTSRPMPDGRTKDVPKQMPGWIVKRMGEDYHRLGFDKVLENAGGLALILGGHPDECPETYRLFSAANHVHSGCPPTLLVHGEHDILAPVNSTRLLFARLRNEKVPVVMHILPATEHGFDMILPAISPPAHSGIYDVERFLALQINTVGVRRPAIREGKEPHLVH